MSVPLVSVVVASVSGWPSLAACLEALRGQEGDLEIEVIVADRCGGDLPAAVRTGFPDVSLFEMPPHTSIPALRARGLRTARGRFVAILEDHCNVDSRWALALQRSVEAGHLVFGGSVENGAVQRSVDWAVFFCEYARFMPPLQRGPAAEITGNNSVYERALLERMGEAVHAELWESFLHASLHEQGVAFHCEPDLRVVHAKSFGFLYFISQRYHYSRSFAGMRLREAGLGRRLLYAGATPLLPPLLLARLVLEVRRKPGNWGRFARALPALGVFLPVWAWGETVGALLGPGRSLERVE